MSEPAPDITLRAVTRETYEAVCDLDTAPDQRDFVSTNTWSLVESHYNPHYVARAIVAGDAPVGFIMWVPDDAAAPRSVSIWRLMIDKAHQKKGYGRLALERALAEIRRNSAIERIEICYSPANDVARKLYAGFGFREIGMDDDGDEMIAAMPA